jgi:hypothetical protein
MVDFSAMVGFRKGATIPAERLLPPQEEAIANSCITPCLRLTQWRRNWLFQDNCYVFTLLSLMIAITKRRWGLVAVLIVATVIAFAALLHFGLRVLKSQVEKALGPESEVAEINIGLGAVEVLGLRIKGSKGWPVADTLRAKRILVEPNLRSLFSDRIHVSAIVVEDAYISALRASNGRMKVVPSLLKGKSDAPDEPPTKINIGRIELRNAAVELFDATVARPPFKIRLEQLNAAVDNIEIPEMTTRTAIDIKSVMKGRHRDGHIQIKGWMVVANQDSAIASRFRDVDLAALQPYLIKAADTGVRTGTLDLDLDATVENKHLHAPGIITLRNLTLDGGGNFMGYARQAATVVLKDSNDRMTVKFVLEGNLDDPGFSLNENLAMRFGYGLAEAMDVSVEGIAQGVGGLGHAVKNLFGK